MATVQITLSASSLAVGTSIQAIAVLRDAAGAELTGRTVSWATSNASIATVSSSGVVTGVVPGAIAIAATSEGVSGTASITVTPAPVATVLLQLPAPTLTLGAAYQAAVTLRDASGNALTDRTVTWESSSPAIASVSPTGRITALALGSATITASSEGKSASASLQVTPVPLATVAITPATLTLGVGQSATLSAVLRDANGAVVTDRPVSWTSSNTAVASVSQAGVVTALTPGSATVAASVEGKVAAVPVTVAPGPASRLVIGTPAAGAFSGRAFATQPLVSVQDAWNSTMSTDNATSISVTVSQGATLIGTTTRQVTSGVVNFSGLALTGNVGSTYTLTFTSANLLPASQTLLLAPFSFGSGTRMVGADIVPGLYRSNNGQSASCYWERLSGFGGTLAEVIANDIGRGPALVQIDSRDKGFNSSGCAQWLQVTGGITASLTAPFPEGTYLVGRDVSAGLWRSSANNSSCYWARLAGFGGTSGELVANYINDGPAVVDIAPTDAGFASSRCGTWTRVNGPITQSTTAPFGHGTFIVGTDIAPGTWQATTPGTSCYWERLRGFSGVSADRIGNYLGATPAVVTIAVGDVGFTSSRCGQWVKMP